MSSFLFIQKYLFIIFIIWNYQNCSTKICQLLRVIVTDRRLKKYFLLWRLTKLKWSLPINKRTLLKPNLKSPFRFQRNQPILLINNKRFIIGTSLKHSKSRKLIGLEKVHPNRMNLHYISEGTNLYFWQISYDLLVGRPSNIQNLENCQTLQYEFSSVWKSYRNHFLDTFGNMCYHTGNRNDVHGNMCYHTGSRNDVH